jgi:hypothetical protein
MYNDCVNTKGLLVLAIAGLTIVELAWYDCGKLCPVLIIGISSVLLLTDLCRPSTSSRPRVESTFQMTVEPDTDTARKMYVEDLRNTLVRIEELIRHEIILYGTRLAATLTMQAMALAAFVNLHGHWIALVIPPVGIIAGWKLVLAAEAAQREIDKCAMKRAQLTIELNKNSNAICQLPILGPLEDDGTPRETAEAGEAPVQLLKCGIPVFWSILLAFAISNHWNAIIEVMQTILRKH